MQSFIIYCELASISQHKCKLRRGIRIKVTTSSLQLSRARHVMPDFTFAFSITS